MERSTTPEAPDSSSPDSDEGLNKNQEKVLKETDNKKIAKQSITNSEKNGKPDTASSMFNWLTMGGLLIVVGMMFVILNSKKRYQY